MTAPYGRENRDQAVEHLLWSLENLSDEDIASMLMLPTEKDPSREAARVSLVLPQARSSTPPELAALLLSDERLVRSLLHAGSHESLRRLSYLSTVPPAMLDGSSTPSVHDMYERIALEAFDPDSASSPTLRRNALRHIQKVDVLEGVLLERLFDVASADPAEYPLAVMAKLAANPNISSTLAKRLFEFASTLDQQAAGSLLKALSANPAAPQDVSGSLSG